MYIIRAMLVQFDEVAYSKGVNCGLVKDCYSIMMQVGYRK